MRFIIDPTMAGAVAPDKFPWEKLLFAQLVTTPYEKVKIYQAAYFVLGQLDLHEWKFIRFACVGGPWTQIRKEHLGKWGCRIPELA